MRAEIAAKGIVGRRRFSAPWCPRWATDEGRH